MTSKELFLFAMMSWKDACTSISTFGFDVPLKQANPLFVVKNTRQFIIIMHTRIFSWRTRDYSLAYVVPSIVVIIQTSAIHFEKAIEIQRQ